MTRTVFRIDDRLIHGQVLEGWVRNLSLTRITIVSDMVVADEEYRKLLEFCVPQEINVDIFSVKEMAEKNKNGYLDKEDTIVLFESPEDVLALLDYGVRIDSVNVGCLRYNGANCQIMKSISVSEEDIRSFEDIISMGSRIECRSLPQDKKVDLMELLNKIK